MAAVLEIGITETNHQDIKKMERSSLGIVTHSINFSPSLGEIILTP